MFKSIGVEASWKFDDALRNIRADPRYQFIKMNMSSKRNTFKSYLEDLKSEEKKQLEFKYVR